MDYSKFYLKNYVPEQNDDEKEQQTILSIKTRTQPEIIYINPDGEVFDPKIDNIDDKMESENVFRSDREVYISDEISHFTPEVVRKPEKQKQSVLNRFCQATLIFAIIIMSIIVSADFISDGKAISAIASVFSPGEIKYYAVLTNPKSDIESCKADSYAMRLKGGAGFIVKNEEKYYNVYAVFEKESDADDYIKENGGELLVLTTDFYKDIDGELKSYTDYPVKVCEELDTVLNDLSAKNITTAQALEKLNEIKENFAVTYDNMNNAAKSDSNAKSVSLLANASVASSALDYLCNTSVSRPNLACDIRYTVCSILFTYCYSE